MQTGSEEPVVEAELELVWVDTYQLFPYGFDPVAEEVENLLEQLGVKGTWKTDISDMYQPPKRNEMRVFLTKANSAGWGLTNNALGVSLGNPSHYIYVFVPNLLAALNINSLEKVTQSSRLINELARAMARVIVHEIGHFFNSGRPHTEHGLMSATLTAGHLRRGKLVLDKESMEFIRLPLIAALSISKRRSTMAAASVRP